MQDKYLGSTMYNLGEKHKLVIVQRYNAINPNRNENEREYKDFKTLQFPGDPYKKQLRNAPITK